MLPVCAQFLMCTDDRNDDDIDEQYGACVVLVFSYIMTIF